MRDDDAAPEPSHEEIVERAARELATLERPPGMLRRVSARVKAGASHHIRLAFEEVRESREAWSLLHARVRHGRKLEPAESAAVCQQLIDAMKTLPAGVLTAATGAIPFPGAILLAPWMLQRLGLLPSRWREEAVLGRLREQAEHLREEGDHIAAERMECLLTEFESRSASRHAAAERTTMLTHWDLDGSGEIEGEEREAYDAEVERVAGDVAERAHDRCLYLQLHGHVVGPMRLDETTEADPGVPLFVCLDGETAWVLLADVRAEVERRATS